MSKPFQFSMRRMFVATTLIAVGFGAFAHLAHSFDETGPMSLLAVIEALISFPLIGAGFFTPIKRPILGACLGFLSFWVFLLWWAGVSGAMSV
jgi:hypothetical protein